MKTFSGAVAAWACLATLTRGLPQPEVPKPPMIMPLPPNGNWSGKITPDFLAHENVTEEFGYPPNGTFEVPAPDYPMPAEIRQWEADGECPASYFEVTPEHEDASGYVTWYWNATQALARESPAEYEGKGEIRAFYGKYLPEAWDFHCDMHHGGCKRLFSCAEIVRATSVRNKDMGTRELLEQARKVYFAHHKQWNIARNLHYAYTLSGFVQSNSIGKINRIVTTFTRQPNAMADAICALIKDGIDLLLDVLSSVASCIPMGDIPSKILNKIKDVGFKFGKDFGNSLYGSIPGQATASVGWARAFYGMLKAYKTAKTSLQAEDQGHGIPGMGDNKMTTGMCAAAGAGIEDQNIERQNAVANFITDNSMAIRYGLNNLMDLAYHGDVQNGVAGSVLAHMMFSKEWSVAKRDAGADEAGATASYLHMLTTGLFRNQKCFLQCTRDTPTSLCGSNSTSADRNGHRYCEDGRACQVSCMTSQPDNNHNVALYGHDALRKEFGISLPELGEISYRNYVQNGRDNMALQNPVTNFIRSVLEGNPNHKPDLNLPVCESNQLADLGDVKENWNDYHHPNFKRFPATCGDWTGNETENFMSGIGMDPNSTSFIRFSQGNSGKSFSKEMFESFYPWNLAHLPPANNYLNLCRLGISMPLKISHKESPYRTGEDKGFLHRSHRVHPGKDRHCDAILQKASAMTPERANTWFCTESEEAQEIFRYQSGHIDVMKPGAEAKKSTWNVLGPLPSHKRQCKKYMKNHGKLRILRSMASMFVGGEDEFDLDAQYIDDDGMPFEPDYSMEEDYRL